MATIYYELATGLHCGSEAIESILPNADDLNSVELDSLGWVKAIIPDHWVQIFDIEYVDGQLIIRNDPPPYWDKLNEGVIHNSLFQRLKILRKNSNAVSLAMIQVFEVMAGSKNVTALDFVLKELLEVLTAEGGVGEDSVAITESEKLAVIALLIECGFPDLITPPADPID